MEYIFLILIGGVFLAIFGQEKPSDVDRIIQRGKEEWHTLPLGICTKCGSVGTTRAILIKRPKLIGFKATTLFECTKCGDREEY